MENAPILSLGDKCFDEIFDYLTLKDLCAVSETNKHLRKVAGGYFERNYQSIGVVMKMKDGHIQETVNGIVSSFATYAQQLQIFDEDVKVFKYIESNVNPMLRSVFFVMLGTTKAELIKNVLANVELIKLIFCLTDDSSYDSILKHCRHLKHLIIADSHDTRKQWPNKNYPHLRDLTVLDSSDGPFNGLHSFFKRNPQIKNFTTSINRNQLFKLMDETNIQLDELAFEIHHFDKTSADSTRNQLNALYKRGCFKRLKISYFKGNNLVDFIRVVQRILGLVSVQFVYCVYHGNLGNELTRVAQALAQLKNLEELGFMQCEISIEQAEILANSLGNLTRVNLMRNSIDVAVPFARRSAKLKTVHIGGNSFCNLSIRNIQNERQKLMNAEKLAIYVPDETFINLKWSQKLNYDLIEIKRNSCLDQAPLHPI